VKVKTLACLMLAAVLVLSALAVGCGSSVSTADGKAQLAAALGDFELSAGAVTQALAAGSDTTVAAEIKASKAGMKAKWEVVVSAAADLELPAKDTAEEAWADVEQAIDALPDNATVQGAIAALSSPMDALMAVQAELWNVAQTTK
jgi:hypothetical protein